MIKAENYIVVQGWMVTELKLKGNDLLVYALIYGFSQIEGQSFNGGLQYLADWTNSTKQGIIKNLKYLVEAGYIEKSEKKSGPEYRSTKFNGPCNKVERGIKQSLTATVKQSLPNNILDNLSNNSNDKEPAPVPATPPVPDQVDELPEEAKTLAFLLAHLHNEVDPTFWYSVTEKQKTSWAEDIDKIHRIDKRDWKDIEAVIRWAKKPDCFWFPNIMSGKKLREKFPTLWAQMSRPAAGVQKHRIAADEYAGGEW